MRRRDWLVFTALTAASAVNLFGQSQETWFGTWTLNLEKSTYAPREGRAVGGPRFPFLV